MTVNAHIGPDVNTLRNLTISDNLYNYVSGFYVFYKRYIISRRNIMLRLLYLMIYIIFFKKRTGF